MSDNSNILPWRRTWQPTPLFLPGRSHGQRSLAGCPWGHKESDLTERLTLWAVAHTICCVWLLVRALCLPHPLVTWVLSHLRCHLDLQVFSLVTLVLFDTHHGRACIHLTPWGHTPHWPPETETLPWAESLRVMFSLYLLLKVTSKSPIIVIKS